MQHLPQSHQMQDSNSYLENDFDAFLDYFQSMYCFNISSFSILYQLWPLFEAIEPTTKSSSSANEGGGVKSLLKPHLFLSEIYY